ncbi:MAG TPA: hypothetical protein PKL48_09735, partial [Thermodesulfobacteriota bacterium]|nr:hypothetical protein [Thermodesulfobacteriota bacterium]
RPDIRKKIKWVSPATRLHGVPEVLRLLNVANRIRERTYGAGRNPEADHYAQNRKAKKQAEKREKLSSRLIPTALRCPRKRKHHD